MKKLFVIVVIMLITVSAFGELPSTKTIETDELTIIRNACQGNDPLIQQYYLDYKGTTFRDEGEVEEIFDERGRAEVHHTDLYMKYAFLGVISVDLIGNSDLYLDFASRYLLDPSFPNDPLYPDHYYLSITDDVIPYLAEIPDPVTGEPSASRKSLDAGYMLENLALIVDMLWWYDGHGLDQQVF